MRSGRPIKSSRIEDAYVTERHFFFFFNLYRERQGAALSYYRTPNIAFTSSRSQSSRNQTDNTTPIEVIVERAPNRGLYAIAEVVSGQARQFCNASEEITQMEQEKSHKGKASLGTPTTGSFIPCYFFLF